LITSATLDGSRACSVVSTVAVARASHCAHTSGTMGAKMVPHAGVDCSTSQTAQLAANSARRTALDRKEAKCCGFGR
jgi:hypothetical protein